MTLGDKIKTFRIEKGLSQENLARQLGIHRKTIAFYEKNKTQPPVDILQKIAVALGISSDLLLTEDPNEVAGMTVQDKSLIPTFKDIENLSDTGKDVIKTVVEGLVLREKNRK